MNMEERIKKEDFIDKWEETKSKGRLAFATRKGLVFGFGFYFFISIVNLTRMSFYDSFFSFSSLFGLVLWLLIGIGLYGGYMWRSNESEYEKIKAELEEEK